MPFHTRGFARCSPMRLTKGGIYLIRILLKVFQPLNPSFRRNDYVMSHDSSIRRRWVYSPGNWIHFGRVVRRLHTDESRASSMPVEVSWGQLKIVGVSRSKYSLFRPYIFSLLSKTLYTVMLCLSQKRQVNYLFVIISNPNMKYIYT